MLCYHLMFFPAVAFPAPTRGDDSPALPHLLPACQFNLTTLQERFDLIKPVAVSILLRGPSVSLLRLRLDADNYFFFLGYGLPLPFSPWGEQGGRSVSWDLRIEAGRSKEGSGTGLRAPLVPYMALFKAEQQPRGWRGAENVSRAAWKGSGLPEDRADPSSVPSRMASEIKPSSLMVRQLDGGRAEEVRDGLHTPDHENLFPVSQPGFWGLRSWETTVKKVRLQPSEFL